MAIVFPLSQRWGKPMFRLVFDCPGIAPVQLQLMCFIAWCGYYLLIAPQATIQDIGVQYAVCCSAVTQMLGQSSVCYCALLDIGNLYFCTNPCILFKYGVRGFQAHTHLRDSLGQEPPTGPGAGGCMLARLMPLVAQASLAGICLDLVCAKTICHHCSSQCSVSGDCV